jgi:hypothetical protein
MTVDDARYDDARAELMRVRSTLLDLRRKVTEQHEPASGLDHCIDLVHLAQAEGEASDVAFIAGHLDAAIRHVETGLALCDAAQACLDGLTTLGGSGDG